MNKAQNNAAEDTGFKVKKTLNCRGRILDLSTPVVMGVLNVTPDSFHDGGKYTDATSLSNHVASMISEGATIIDVGGQSTRPRAKQIDPETEWMRIEPAVNVIAESFPEVVISVDTFYSAVAAKAVLAGAAIINDISAGSFDDRILDVAAEFHTPFIAMHIQGTPLTMQDNPYYDDVLASVIGYFTDAVQKIKRKGVHDIILDPGFGFGKNVEHNYTLLNKLEVLQIFGYPLLAGLSRKSLITKVLDCPPADALNGTTVLNTVALLKGASILRVHDVREAMEAIKIISRLSSRK